MTFLNPDYLLFMLLPSFVFFYLIVTNSNKLDNFFDPAILKKIRYEGGGLGRVGRNIMLFTALLLMILALARPVVQKGSVKVETKTIDVLVAIDVSNSMRANDLYPDRFEFAKRKFFRFLDKFPEANVGVVAFSSNIFMVSPMTNDFETVKYLVNNLSFDSISSGGTDLMLPVEISKKFLKDSKYKILVIFTDGGDDKDFSKETKEAKKTALSVYIYATATEKGAAVNVNGKVLKDKNQNIVISRLNENIRELAIKSGGAFIKGTYKDKDIDLVIKDIRGKFKANRLKSRKIKDYRELFYYPLALALLFMLFAFSSLPSRGKKTAVLFIAALFFNTDANSNIVDFFNIKKAKEAYEKGDYRRAGYYFEKVAESKESSQSYYDLGNSYYKQKEYKKAIEAYEMIKSDDKELNFKRYYNEGNAYFKSRDIENAIKMYEKAKEYGTDDDLEYNLKLAKKLKKQKRQQEEKESKKKSKKQKKDKKKKDQKKGNKQQNRKNKGKNKESKENKKSASAKSQKEKQKQKNKKQKRTPISDMEEKKWERLLEKKKPKTLPLELKTDKEKKRDEKPW